MRANFTHSWKEFILRLFCCAGIFTGCSPSIPTLVAEGKTQQAWSRACERKLADRKTPLVLTLEERQAFQVALLDQTKAKLEGRVLSREEIHERLGETMFPSEMVMIHVRLTALAHPGRGIIPRLRAVENSRTWTPWLGDDAWRLAHLEPPVQPGGSGFNFGAVAGAIISFGTMGAISPSSVSLDAPFITGGSSGSPGGGTFFQRTVMSLLALRGNGCSVIRYARLGEPCEAVFLLAPKKPPSDEQAPPISITTVTTQREDSLVVGLEFGEDRHIEPTCTFRQEIPIPLPRGSRFLDRVRTLFSKGPIELGGIRQPHVRH